MFGFCMLPHYFVSMFHVLQIIRAKDTVVIYKIERISRSTKHLIELTELFDCMDVSFISLQDNIDTSKCPRTAKNLSLANNQ